MEETTYIDGYELYRLLLHNEDYLLGEEKSQVKYYDTVSDEGVYILEVMEPQMGNGPFYPLPKSFLWTREDFIEKKGSTLFMPVYETKEIIKLEIV